MDKGTDAVDVSQFYFNCNIIIRCKKMVIICYKVKYGLNNGKEVKDLSISITIIVNEL